MEIKQSGTTNKSTKEIKREFKNTQRQIKMEMQHNNNNNNKKKPNGMQQKQV